MIQHFSAVIAYGVLALATLAIYALHRDADTALAIVVAISGITWVFQTLQYHAESLGLTAFGEALISFLYYLIVALYLMACAMAVIGA